MLLSLALAVALPTTSRARSWAGADFVLAAATAQQLQLAFARLALERGGSEVTSLANELLVDEQRALAELEVTLELLPDPPRLPDRPDQAGLDALAALSATPDEGFDRAYLQQQLDAQQRLVDLFSWYLAEGEQPELRAYAAATVPILQHHLSATLAGWHASQ